MILPSYPLPAKVFMTKGVAKDIRWRHEKQIKDDVIHHPANTLAWRKLDDVDAQFALYGVWLRLSFSLISQ